MNTTQEGWFTLHSTHAWICSPALPQSSCIFVFSHSFSSAVLLRSSCIFVFLHFSFSIGLLRLYNARRSAWSKTHTMSSAGCLLEVLVLCRDVEFSSCSKMVLVSEDSSLDSRGASSSEDCCFFTTSFVSVALPPLFFFLVHCGTILTHVEQRLPCSG